MMEEAEREEEIEENERNSEVSTHWERRIIEAH